MSFPMGERAMLEEFQNKNAALRAEVAECKAELAAMVAVLREAEFGLKHADSFTESDDDEEYGRAATALLQVQAALYLPHAKAAHERWRKMERLVKAAMELRRLNALSDLPPGKAPKVIDFTGAQAEYTAALAALYGEGKA